jgi:hypothetical protein
VIFGGTASMPVRERGQGEPTLGQHVPFSGRVQAHTPGERRAFAPAATEDTGERDSPPEQRGFEPPVPGAEAITKRNGVLREDCPPNQLTNAAALF